MARQTVAGKPPVELDHQPVARGLGQNRSGGDRDAERIATHDPALGDRQLLERTGVDQQIARYQRKSLDGAAHGQERILINCAGTGNAIKTASRDKQTGETKHFPLDAFNWIIQINLVGTFRCIAKSAKGMLDLEPLTDGERGVIINTASVAAEDGQMGQAANSKLFYEEVVKKYPKSEAAKEAKKLLQN